MYGFYLLTIPFSFSIFFAALTVRYLTRRFIGEYRSKTDLLYRQTVTLDSGLLDIEIVDISAENDEFPSEQLQWADACLIVYSITDRSSYEYASRSLGEMRQLQSTPIAYLVGNKADLDHLRQVIKYALTIQSDLGHEYRSFTHLDIIYHFINHKLCFLITM